MCPLVCPSHLHVLNSVLSPDLPPSPSLFLSQCHPPIPPQYLSLLPMETSLVPLGLGLVLGGYLLHDLWHSFHPHRLPLLLLLLVLVLILVTVCKDHHVHFYHRDSQQLTFIPRDLDLGLCHYSNLHHDSSHLLATLLPLCITFHLLLCGANIRYLYRCRCICYSLHLMHCKV